MVKVTEMNMDRRTWREEHGQMNMRTVSGEFDDRKTNARRQQEH